MKLTVNVPLNNVSFGQTSTIFIRELFKRNLTPNLFPISQPDISVQSGITQEFANWLNGCLNKSFRSFNQDDPIFRLWHLNGGLETYRRNQTLFTFYEADSPTIEEIKAVKENKKVIFSSDYTVDIFKTFGCNNLSKIQLPFDSYNFKRLDKKFHTDGRITFCILGKLERRKHHAKIIQTWIRKFGNNPKYYLQCAVYNQFMPVEEQKEIYNKIVNFNRVGNVQFMGFFNTNDMYNDFLNSNDIVIAMSGAEGWGIPEFHSVGIGKHAVVLNAHAYKEWANSENSVLVQPNSKIPIYDNKFFFQGAPWNQGNMFDWNEDEFIAACEEAIKRYESNPVNEKGMLIQQKFTPERFFNDILNALEIKI